MRIAVIGGTGVAGRYTVNALRRAGHEAVVVSRSRRVDVSTGKGLDDVLAAVDAVIDVIKMQAIDVKSTQDLFITATRNILAAGQRANRLLVWIALRAKHIMQASACRKRFSPPDRFR